MYNNRAQIRNNMIRSAIRRCPICNHDSVQRIKSVSLDIPDSFALPSDYDIVICRKCGFSYADTSARMEDYDRYYSQCNTYSHTPNTTFSIYNLLKEAFEQHIKKGMTLLDIGVGNGIFDEELDKGGYKIIGIDPSASSISKLQSKGIEGYIGSIYDPAIENLRNKCDVVFLVSVLEHLLDPGFAISRIKDYLNKEGRIFIVVPDYSKISNNSTPLVNNFNQEHINYFSKISLDNLMALQGFENIFQKSILTENNGYKEAEIIVGYSIKNNCGRSKRFVKDEITGGAIDTYIDVELQNERKRKGIIDELRMSQNPIIIWGTGAFTMHLFATTNLKMCNIKGYVDNNPSKIGQEFGQGKNKFTIMSPDQIGTDNYLILINSMLYSKNIEEQIINLGLTNRYLSL